MISSKTNQFTNENLFTSSRTGSTTSDIQNRTGILDTKIRTPRTTEPNIIKRLYTKNEPATRDKTQNVTVTNESIQENFITDVQSLIISRENETEPKQNNLNKPVTDKGESIFKDEIDSVNEFKIDDYFNPPPVDNVLTKDLSVPVDTQITSDVQVDKGIISAQLGEKDYSSAFSTLKLVFAVIFITGFFLVKGSK